MAPGRSLFDTMTVASPCSVSWDGMQGDASVRFCTLCQNNVYDISQMTRAQAEALIEQKEGKICVRFYRRPDGRVVTSDHCVAETVGRWAPWLVPVLAFLGVLLLLVLRIVTADSDDGSVPRNPGALRQVEPFRAVMEWFEPSRPPLLGKLRRPSGCNNANGHVSLNGQKVAE